MIEAQPIQELLGSARVQLDEVRERATQWDESLRRFTREQPLTAILLAATGGYLLARIASRLS
jgi:hypothetical protein